MTPTDFKIGEVVIYHDKQYSCESKTYSPVKRMAVVIEINELFVVLEMKRNEKRDYGIGVGSKCLDLIEKIPQGAIPLRPKAMI